MRKVLTLLTSVRLAVVLILTLAVLALISTFFPAEYFSDQSVSGSFFMSVYFLIPLSLFLINLTACTLQRIYLQIRRKGNRNIFPDLIHVALIIIIGGAFYSGMTRRSDVIFLQEGEKVSLSNDYTLGLLKFQILQDSAGGIKDYLSKVQVSRKGTVIEESAVIEVNHPLRLRGITLYQNSWNQIVRVTVKRDDGDTLTIDSTAPFSFNDVDYRITGFKEDEAGISVLIQSRDENEEDIILTPGTASTLGQVLSAEHILKSGIAAVRDPGYTVVLTGFILMIIGIAGYPLWKNRRILLRRLS